MHYFNKVTVLALIILIGLISQDRTAQAQTFRLITVNTLTGAVTGSILGGATIALQDKSEINYQPARFGLGLGTIMGLGTGFYDFSRASGNVGYQVYGVFSSTGASGTIILLDTFYGAATGVLVGTAISLMTESDIIKGIQFGSAAGAWVGFAFGLVDAFALSSSGSYDSFYDDYASRYRPGNNSLIALNDVSDIYCIGFLNPVIINTPAFTHQGYMTSRLDLGIELMQINIAL